MTERSQTEWDYIVIGSGFGGSVSALRLAEKGYRVAVLERGKRLRPADFPKSNWDVRKYLWMPKLKFFGIQAMTLLRHVMVLHGAGVGGGSLVYASVLKEPEPAAWKAAPWQRLGLDGRVLAPFYETARRMLGVAMAPVTASTDLALREIASEFGCGDTFQAMPVGIYFGRSGETAKDPFFGGEGPDRTGCRQCGSCLSGCRYGSKNTLDQNYLHLAEKKGVTIFPETEVLDIAPAADGVGYTLTTRRSTRWFSRKTMWRTRGVVLSGGVLGTVPLLLKCQQSGSLSRVSPRLGDYVRTNSEALTGATSHRFDMDATHGVAIAAGLHAPDGTSVEMVRYGHAHGVMSLLCGPLLSDAEGRPLSFPRWVLRMLGRPRALLRMLDKRRWAERTGILLAMQSSAGELRLSRTRPLWKLGLGHTNTTIGAGEPPAAFLPVADEMARSLAAKIGGEPQTSLNTMLLKRATTAHILGGCCLGPDAESGAVGPDGRLFGYENFYVLDGSIIPANLGVNPSLTITALSEWIMSRVPAAPRPR